MKIYPKEKISEVIKWIFALPLTYTLYFVLSLLIPQLDLFTTEIIRFSFLLFAFFLICKFFLKFKIQKHLNINFKKLLTSFLLSLILFSALFAGRYFINSTSFVRNYNLPSASEIIKIILLIVVASLTEELIFRIFIGNFCNKVPATGNYWKYCLASALIFSIAHFENPETSEYGIQAMVFYFVFGCALMFFYLKSGSVEFSLSVHLANNCISAFLVSYPNAVLQTESLFIAPFSLIQSLIEILTVTLLFIFFFTEKHQGSGI